MSLAEQTQQWYPTSVQVTVHQARNLKIKGKNGTNDAYAIIQVAKDKFSTSVAEKCVAPVWKEEASFDLPLFHQANADRCTLYIIVMHRALVGLDKLLGQAIINLVELHDNKSRKKTDWYKLVDKNGKADKDRGEVLLDVQFMRNNMTASMFDLSMQDKPRSRISKLKDKVRGKKREGFSDSASAIVPSVSQALTDSDGEGDGKSDSPGMKKSSKLKSLFAPKTNLQRNVSQSMSTLGSLPEKNGSLSGSRSSGLNVDSPDVKKKFKFLGHKRTSSTDSRVSQGPFSLLGRSKQNVPEQNNLCINGSHVYTEEQESKPATGSTLSLNSSGQGSVEDVRKFHERNPSDASTDSFKGLSVPSYRPEPRERTVLTPQRPLEDRGVHAQYHLQEEDEDNLPKRGGGRSLQDMLDKQEEQERKRQQEREETRRKLEEEERRRKLEEQEKRQQEEARQAEEEKRKRREEEMKKAEEQRQQEETRMTDRLSYLFGIGKKKEEKKEEENPPAVEKPKHLDVPSSTNPFEDVPLSPEESSGDFHRGVRTPNPPASASVFPTRVAKVSAVKPRPHPVKPMSTVENQAPSSLSVGKDLKSISIHEVTDKSKGMESGPYTQLTQEELITLVVKQQAELTKKDDKIQELEDYIDNLLVRVIEEKPSILLALNSKAKH
ncbi:rab11 family-interacting protein 1 isoform X2 [Chanos chanos]|uniref:Rab11 family-interacting protein 1 isoform X2 n=1 Tax=Chanos chanos TaxID=29144 RepID=A0A6J2UV10_CHACN|nr:rab11 family-interacting protein 1-like isoform X2 [Chanos chanos]